MRIAICLVAAVLGCTQVLAADGAADTLDEGAAKAKDCLACHNSMVSLQGRGTAVIAEQINAIRSGEAPHPPGLADLKEADIDAIAAYLDVAD